MRVAEEKAVTISDELLERLSDARRRSDALFNLLRGGDARVSPLDSPLYARPIPERHRIIFYVGHLEAFDWNLLKGLTPGIDSADHEFDRLFAFGIDPVGGGLPTDLPSDWPSLEAVRDYVNHVRNTLDKSLASMSLDPDTPTRDAFSLTTLLNVAVEHRLMHVETLAYMLHQLPLDMKQRQKVQYLDSPNLASPLVPQTIAIPSGSATMGLARDAKEFGWDNEYEAHTVEVPAFEIDQYKVTNRQYLEFIADGGYETLAFWNGDNHDNQNDWNWKTANGISHPLFWKKGSSGQTWVWQTMFDEVPLPLDWPVYVSQAEAAAYARWAGKSLPTEAEWHRAAYGARNGEARPYPWGSEPPNSKLGNFDFHRWDPVPVNSFPEGQSIFGVHDLLGNGWEWTSTVFAPFSGFKPFPFYRGYSADFFDGRHFVMKGGSPRTASCMLRSTFRNWFQGHYQYVYAGFRCVRR